VTLPALVATDLDGTLLRSDGTVSDYTQRVLAELDERDVPVVIVTARPLRWMDDLWHLVGSHSMAIVSNGGIWYDAAGRHVRHLVGIDAEVGLALCAAIQQAVPGAAFAIECLSGIKIDERFVEPHHVPEGSPRGPLAELWDEPAVKLMVRHEEMTDPVTFREAVVAAVGDAAVATWSGERLVEISALGVTKAATLSLLADELGVGPEEVVAFGDMPNDLPMLEWAGTAYAMANADPIVLEAADHIAPSNDDDGVARVLASVFGLDIEPAIAPVVE
jgi:Cof subfamily protein (haloacid dehalogenase superfamily)